MYDDIIHFLNISDNEYKKNRYFPWDILLNAKLNKKKNKENSQNKRKSLIKVNE